ncbi:UPF0261 domain-containing protein [Mollisia scopiformis]|uniref:UPF0261 domain-containing protein n=1 Tax=Mollisia scopiformis TaxID=149040 RepID=A0A132B3P5_MOLSC|nr:UPF0261 domain-containing protein [Mollisia scopiformis]KUJ06544.1 UPF0261 domain-containing protein [Mollisia scopiformis]
MPHIVLIGTLDTKLQEFLYLHQQLNDLSTSTSSPLKVTLIDCGRTNIQHEAISISQQALIAEYGGSELKDTMKLPRGEVIQYMTQCCTACLKTLLKDDQIHGILGAGGSGGTSLVSAVMRDAAPFGLPKLIVSTVASGDTSLFVGETDITMMNSVVDIAGTNELLLNVLSNAAGAMVGMSAAYERTLERRSKETAQQVERVTRIGITMFGVTTPCVNYITQYLTKNYPVETYVFHATGHGGKAMERLVEEGRLDAVLDLTTTEICDHLFGGNMSAGPNRLEAALSAGIPNIISLGATDMVNFGARKAVPAEYLNRLLLEHNPTVTLMRTTKEECDAIGKFMVEKIKGFAKDQDMIEVWIPKGASVVSTPGEIFADEEADAALAEAIKKGLEGTKIKIVQDTRHINEESFASDIAESLMKIVSRKKDGV